MLAGGYFREDTIVALATGSGGAISIVRVSGPRAFEALEKITGSKSIPKSEPGKLVRAKLYFPSADDPAQPHLRPTQLDDALCVRFVAPQSFTGEDLVEFHTHGGSYIPQRLIQLLVSTGLRQALPGEFSFRAVRNGKMSLFQAQAVSDLISARNDRAVHLASEKLSGTHNSFLNQLASELRELAALGELGIDFADQDVPEVSLPHLKNRLHSVRTRLQHLFSSFDRGVRIQEGIQVVLVGLPNAGKSSLFNSLLGEDRSIVSEEEGTTRDIVREQFTLRNQTCSVTLRMEDTAGLRKTQSAVETLGIERTLHAAQRADLILFVLDPLAELSAVNAPSQLSLSDRMELLWKHLTTSVQNMDELAPRALGVLTKCDLLDAGATEEALKALKKGGVTQWYPTSSLTGEGIPSAAEAIVRFCEEKVHREPGEILLTRMDHLAATEAGLQHIDRAAKAPEIDLFAADLRQALFSLSPLIGETATDDLLEKIFSSFCIGK